MKSVTSLANPLNRRKPVKPAKPEVPLNHIAILVDESGSMEHLRTKVPGVVQEQINAIRQSSYDAGQETLVSIYSFNTANGRTRNGVRTEPKAHCVNAFPEAAIFGPYHPGGGTPLNDSIHFVLDRLEAAKKGRADESFLVIVVTDGDENESAASAPGARIHRLLGTDRWSFAFLVPPGATHMTMTRTNVAGGCIQEWEATEAGLRQASVSTQAGIGNYYAARAAGGTKTAAFFTDLSKVKKADLKKLEDVSGDLKRWTVDKESPIAEFVQRKFGSYSIGHAYYELTKPEKIQSHKDLLIAERASKKVFGGSQAKALIGLTSGPGVTVAVKPGNHANFRIFVKSTSMNRKLVRGTDLLYRVR